MIELPLAGPQSISAQTAGGTSSYPTVYQLAQQRNLEVQAARAKYAIRQAELRIAAQRPNPLLSAEIAKDTPHLSTLLEVPVELGGKRARRIGLAESELKLQDAELADAFRKLRRDLRKAFYGRMLADQRIALAEAEVEIAQRVFNTAEERYKAGAVAFLETLQAGLGLSRARAGLEFEQKQRLASEAELRTVLNLTAEERVPVSGSLSEFAPDFQSAVYLATALRENPELQLLSIQLEVENQRLRLFKAEAYPDLNLIAGVDSWTPEFAAGPRAGFSIELPLHKKRAGQIEQTRALQEQIKLAHQAIRRRVEGLVQSALARLEAQRTRMRSFQTEIVPAALELERLAEESYREGKSSILTVLEAQKSLRDVRVESLQAEFDFQMSAAELEEVAGVPLP
ncbi:MAG TPA: TolC family protein [Acidobacteriota bacterium]